MIPDLSGLAQAPAAPRASKRWSEWIWYLIADAMALDIAPADCRKDKRSPGQNAARAKVRALVAAWMRDGTLVQSITHDARNRRPVPVIVAGTLPGGISEVQSSVDLPPFLLSRDKTEVLDDAARRQLSRARQLRNPVSCKGGIPQTN